MSLTLEIKKKAFETLWAQYPNKDGKKQAWAHFNNNIKTYQDITEITAALNNYISHLKQEDWKKPKNGSTWFNNYLDWVPVQATNKPTERLETVEEMQARHKEIKMRMSQAYQTKLQLKYRALRMQSYKLLALKYAPGNMW